MDIDIRPVLSGEEKTLYSLLEKYLYEHSQYDGKDVDASGNYMEELCCLKEGQEAFFMEVDGKIAGFVMLETRAREKKVTSDYVLTEFCVLYKYRRSGIGRYTVLQLFQNYQGSWQVRCNPKNMISLYFWNQIIKEYTKDKFRMETDVPEIDIQDASRTTAFYFET